MTTDIADFIAGAFGVSRGAAYDLMREALKAAQPDMAWVERERAVGYREGHMAALAQRQWVGLTDAEILEVLCIWPDADDDPDDYMEDIREARAIEAKLRQKNGGQA